MSHPVPQIQLYYFLRKHIIRSRPTQIRWESVKIWAMYNQHYPCTAGSGKV